MSNDDFDDDDEVGRVVVAAIGELLNLAAQVAELQMTDEGAEDIYAICDLVAEYYQIERAVAVTEEHDDGSFTTRFETYTGATPEPEAQQGQREPIPGSICTRGKPKLRLIDCATPLDLGTPNRRPKGRGNKDSDDSEDS
jgi:hypothetical protein